MKNLKLDPQNLDRLKESLLEFDIKKMKISTLELKPGDILMISIPDGDKDFHEEIEKAWKDALGELPKGCRILFYSDIHSINILKKRI